MIAIPQSVTRRIPLKAYLSSDHVSAATGKTIAVVISKNGAAFGNPSAGATNATEIANGWYYVDLSTTDTGTGGPLIVRGTASGVDDVETFRYVADAHNAGFDGVPSATAGATNGLPIIGTNSTGTLTGITVPTVTTVTTTTNLTNAATSGDLTTTMKTSVTTACTASTPTAAAVTGNVGGNVVGSVGSVVADVGITQSAADKVFSASGAAMAELSAVPSATPSPRNALMLLFMTLRNKLTVTASAKSVFNDAGTSVAAKSLADDGTTYTESKMA